MHCLTSTIFILTCPKYDRLQQRSRSKNMRINEEKNKTQPAGDTPEIHVPFSYVKSHTLWEHIWDISVEIVASFLNQRTVDELDGGRLRRTRKTYQIITRRPEFQESTIKTLTFVVA